MSALSLWNNLPAAQQQQFMRQAGLQAPPDPARMSGAQFAVLAGILGQQAAPGREAGGPGKASGYSAASPSLAPPAKNFGDLSSIMVKLAELRSKMGDLQVKIGQADIQGKKDDMARANAEETKRLQDMVHNLKGARASGAVGKIFGWVGVAIGVAAASVALAVAIVATVATAGTAWPLIVGAAVLLSVAVAGVALMTLQETGAMKAITGALADFVLDHPKLFFGWLPFGAGKAVVDAVESGTLRREHVMLALNVGVQVAMLAASVAAAGVGLACAIATGGAATPLLIGTIGTVASCLAGIVGGFVQLGSAGAGLAQTAFSFEASQLEAESKENRAWLARLQQLFEEEADRLRAIIEQMNRGFSEASETLADIFGSHRAVLGHMGC